MRILPIAAAASSLALCSLARAVYAPIPELEQGKDFTLSIQSGISYNNNIFGASTGAIGSFDFMVSPKIAFNQSLTNQTFFSASYNPTLDYFNNRPSTKAVYSHAVDTRLAHSFSQSSVLDVSDKFSYTQNPESLLNGVPVNTDQTQETNEFNGRCSFAPTQQLGMVIKARSMYFDYTNRFLSSLLNRFENLYGVEADYTLDPRLKAAGEYRHEDVDYSNQPSQNNKHSDFLMAGFDYSVGPQLTSSVRVGGEYRERAGLPTETTPYAELSGKYDYAKGSFVSVGYTYSLEETSDPAHYSDEKVNRIFANIQHAFSPLIVGSASLDYEPAALNGRPGTANINEDSTHAGVAVTYLPVKNWTVTASYDYDFVDSALNYRGMNRSRVGVSAKVQF
jgi:hypothetical protein